MDEKAAEHWKHVARLKARAIIEAMREPTEKMESAIYPARISVGTEWMNSHEATLAWQAMIDAALAEEGSPVVTTS